MPATKEDTALTANMAAVILWNLEDVFEDEMRLNWKELEGEVEEREQDENFNPKPSQTGEGEEGYPGLEGDEEDAGCGG